MEHPKVSISPNVNFSTAGSNNIPNPIKTINIEIHKWIFLFVFPIKNIIIGTIKTLVPVIKADLVGVAGIKNPLLPKPSHKPVVWNEYPRKRNIAQITPDINSLFVILIFLYLIKTTKKVKKNAIKKRTKENIKGVTSSKDFETNSKVIPQINVVKTRPATAK